jgi:DNA-binding transcriptional LysR family regulator
MSTSAGASWVGLEIRHLAALEAVARAGSFRGAAQQLGYVQSAISHQILALERVVGATLVQRTRGSRLSVLTPAGEVLLEHASAILARVRVAQTDVASIANERGTVFRVGSYQNLAALFVTPVLPRLRVSAGSIVFVERDSGSAMQALLRDRAVDVAVTQHPIEEPALLHADLLDDPYVVLVPSGSLAGRRRRPLTLEEVARSGLVAHGPTRTRVETELAARGFEPRIRFRSDNNATVHALVAASAGCAVLPRLAAVASPGVTVLPLEPPDALPPRRLVLAWHADRASAEIDELVVAVTRQAARIAAALDASCESGARRRA